MTAACTLANHGLDHDGVVGATARALAGHRFDQDGVVVATVRAPAGGWVDGQTEGGGWSDGWMGFLERGPNQIKKQKNKNIITYNHIEFEESIL